VRINDLNPLIIYIPLVQFRLQNVNTLTRYTSRMSYESRSAVGSMSRRRCNDFIRSFCAQ